MEPLGHLRATWTLGQVASFLGKSQAEIRLLVKDSVIVPIGYQRMEGRSLYTEKDLYFNREEVMCCWRNFVTRERDMRDEIKMMKVVILEIARNVERVLHMANPIMSARLPDVARALEVNEVTLRRNIKNLGEGCGLLKIRGLPAIPCVKVQSAWRVDIRDLKVAVGKKFERARKRALT